MYQMLEITIDAVTTKQRVTIDVKRGQNLEAEARATRPRAKNNYEKVSNNDYQHMI